MITQQNEKQTGRGFVPFALAIAVIAISFAAIFFRLAAPTHPLVAAGLRLAVAAVLLAPWTLKAALAGKLDRRLVASAMLAGIFYGIHFGTWVTSLTMTTIAASVTLVTTTPLLLAIVGIVGGRDRPETRLWISLSLAFVGLLLIGGADLGRGWKVLSGDALALLGAGAMAGYLITGRCLGDKMNLMAFSGIATAVGAFVLLTAAALFGIPLEAASWKAFGYIFLAALLPQLIGHNLLTWTLRHANPSTVGMAVVGEPVGATLLAWLWLGEGVSWRVALGCAITIVAVAAAIVGTRNAQPIT